MASIPPDPPAPPPGGGSAPPAGGPPSSGGVPPASPPGGGVPPPPPPGGGGFPSPDGFPGGAGGAPPRPPGGSPPPGGKRPGLPWEERDRLGFVEGLVETVRLFITDPSGAWKRTRTDGDIGSPLLFALIMLFVGGILQTIWGALFTGPSLMFLPEEVREQIGPMLAVGGAGAVFQIFMAPIFGMIGVFILTAIIHLCLMIVGGLTGSRAGFEGSFRAVSYSTVANLAYAVPFVGGIICLVWEIILMVIGLSTLHRTTTGRAIAAVLIPFLLCCVCIAAALFFGIAAAVGAAGAAAN